MARSGERHSTRKVRADRRPKRFARLLLEGVLGGMGVLSTGNWEAPSGVLGEAEFGGKEEMIGEHSGLMSRIETTRRELELAVQKIRRDHAGVMTREADLVQENLDYLEELLENGLEDASEETIHTLDGWLPQR